ncbi:MAG: ABC transporter substrate binding protein [Zetaproteobacteria bacterium]|nr:ABC transporter substrate binding protein [Zetaproteobacteria bacterium]
MILYRCILGLLVLHATARIAQAKQVLLLETISLPVVQEHSKWFKLQLKELNPNVHIETYNGEGNAEKIEQFLKARLAKGKVDIVVANATLAAKAAQKLLGDKKIPLVFFTVSQPAKAGLVEQVGAPSGTFITGVPHSVSKKTQVSILKRLLHAKKMRVTFLGSTYPSAVDNLAKLKAIFAETTHLEHSEIIVDYKSGKDAEMKAMQAKMIQKAQALAKDTDFFWILTGPAAEDPKYLIQLQQIKPIVFAPNMEAVRAGTLFTMLPSKESSGRKAARITHAILQGQNPGSIPVEHTKEVSFGLNIKTAAKLGIVVPSDLLDLATGNIYK